MHRIFIWLMAIGVLNEFALSSGFAEPPKRSSTAMVFRGTSIQRTQWSSDSETAAISSNSDTATPGTTPGLLPGASNSIVPSHSGSAVRDGSNSAPSEMIHRPTLQQIQNPSGGFQLSHSSFSQQHYSSPNNYVGTHFNNWNNLRPQSAGLSQFESFNRYQPSLNSGGYTSPNTSFGSANNPWNNLSSGNLSPNYLGGWIYQPY